MAERDKVDRVRAITGAASASDAIDRALDELLRLEQLRNDIAAYTAEPPTVEEIALGRSGSGSSDLADDTDWEAVYADVE